MRAVAIIPARYAASRLPGKPLADIGGKSMIQRVFERVSQVAGFAEVWVATDDERVYSHLEALGANVCMTDVCHLSGTDRCWEAYQKIRPADIVVNVQGDEPFIETSVLQELLSFTESSRSDIVTMKTAIQRESDLFDDNVVKVVCRSNNQALYFSREPIPHLRETDRADWLSRGRHFQHLGVYAFKADALQQATKLNHGMLEQLECLEQLRWLEAGLSIAVMSTDSRSLSVDTPEDLQLARDLFSDYE